MNPIVSFGRHILNQIETGITKEWIETNGLGSYATGTIMGANTRRYHSLFTLTSPQTFQRYVMVNRVEESVLINGRKVDLSCQEYPGTVSPQGYLHLESFTFDPFPTWIYAVDDLRLKKTFFLRSGEETAVLIYKNLLGPAVRLILRPFFSCRPHHHLIHESHHFDQAIEIDRHQMRCSVPQVPEFYTTFTAEPLSALDRVKIYPEGYWYRNLLYAHEEERELRSTEDLYSPCQGIAELAEGQEVILVFSKEKIDNIKIGQWIEQEHFTRQEVLRRFNTQTPFMKRCVQLADSFVVKPHQETKILSGYPWQEETLRDTLISLPGLCLATGRFDSAKDILLRYSKLFYKGLLPDKIISDKVLPSSDLSYYRNIDVSLWWVWAVQKYLEYTKDNDLVKDFKPIVEDIIKYLREGISIAEPNNQIDIRMDSDFLLLGVSNKAPMTWMNANVLERFATPRKGKAVEVQALWYNTLQFAAEISLKFDHQDHGYTELAKNVYDSFNLTFWNSQTNYLYDVVDGNTKEGSIRPNALFAISMPYEVLETGRFRTVVENCWKTLYTSLGLRTLSPTEPHFHGVYKGDERRRASALHNGTVHPFLIGAFLTAYFKTYGRDQKVKEEALHFVYPFVYHLSDAGLGAISELFDGLPPHTPRGAISDVKAVAEIIRVIREEGLVI